MNNIIAEVSLLREEFTSWWDTEVIPQFQSSVDFSILFEMRNYKYRPDMEKVLKDMGMVHVLNTLDLTLLTNYARYKTKEKWGLFKNNRGILDNRWVLPIRDCNNRITALVGWYPDNRKYVTTPTLGFCRSSQFFGIEQYKFYLQSCLGSNTLLPVYVVEGIFDTISLRSLGLYALGNMGLPMPSIKKEILSRYNRVIFIPDSDIAGQLQMPYAGGKNSWNCNVSHTFLELKCETKKIDMDFLINQTFGRDLEIKGVLQNIPNELRYVLECDLK